MKVWAKRLGGALVGLVLFAGIVLAVLDTQIGHRLVADRIAGLTPSNGLRYSIGRIDGSLYGKATLIDIRVADPQGVFLAIPRAELDWSPAKWIANRLDITSLVVPRAVLLRTPRTIKTGKQGPILPDFDIRIGLLRVDRLVLSERVTGVARHGRIEARADIHSGRALLDVAALVEGSDRLRLKLDAAPDADRFDIDVRAAGAAGGVLSRLTGIARPLSVDVGGDGSWAKWAGTATVRAGALTVADLKLDAAQGRYQLAGDLTAAPLLTGKLQRMSAPRVRVTGDGTLVDRRLTGSLTLRSAALDLRAEGTADLAASAWRTLKLDARLLQPQALFPNMTGRNIALRAILDGPFATARFDYRLLADRFAFDDTGFEQARASGRGRLSKAPVLLPIAFTAARVTGIGDVAGGILRNLSVGGVLRVTPQFVTGDDLKLKSDKLTGAINLQLDLRTGKFDVGVNGRLGRYLIPGLGIVDVTSKLNVVPGPNGHGTRVVGTGTAQVLRLDNGFFASLSGGLPRIVTGLERGTDGILYFRGLQLVAPKLRLSGNGYRRRDGTFHFEGGGTQASYGPLTLVLDGKIDKPTLDLVFARPNEALSLRQVRAHLDPTAEGFAFRAAGGSVLGPFTANGAILLPRGGAASIRMDALDVSGTRASGTLRIVSGGFDGRWGITGGGLSGELLFRPVGDIQRIEAHIDARDAKLGGAANVRRGRVDMVALLDPAGTNIEATATATGLQRGALSVARFAGTIKLRGGDGEARASIAGSKGRAFDVQSVINIRDGSYSIRAQGTVDRRPLLLETPAVLTRDGDGWRLAPTRLTFAGGSAQVAGRFGGASSSIDATLARMPLSILDIGYPGLGLGGVASGKLTYSQGQGAPTGRIDMTVRGLSRAGLVLSSRPIDMGLVGVLAPDKAAFRAIMASGGKTIGRAQGQLAPLGQGDLSRRIANAPLFAQLRYDGPADTLWRLTGVELFDLSGPVAVGADARGTLSNPQINGTLRANGARIESATTGTVFTNVQATGRFGGSRLVIDQFAADAGKGRVSGAGAFDFGFDKGGIGIDLKLDAQNARMIDRDDIGATVTGPIAFKSDGRGGTISGDVRLEAASFRLGQASAAAAVPRLNIREINGGDADDAVLDTPPTPWRLDLHAKAANNVRVTGLGLDSNWSADLKIGGEPSNPAISGRADLIRGSYEFAGREFELERGAIRFDGSVPADPTLDIVANADATGISATIRVGGTGQKPEITFASVPALPQDELLSRLLFGTSITNLSAPEALQLAAAVAALQGGGGGGLNPINAVRRAAGLDRLRILPADPQTGQQTSVAAGKYITRRVYAEIITDGQGYSATRLEFQVTRWLSLLGTISTIGRQSANVRVSKDY